MDDSLEDFDLMPMKAVKRKKNGENKENNHSVQKKPLQDCNENAENKKKLGNSKSVVPVSTVGLKEKGVQTVVRKVVDKEVQVGTEMSVNYASKLLGGQKTTYRDLLTKIVPNKTLTLQFCFETGLLPRERNCPTCGKQMTLIQDKKVSDGHRWYCRKVSGANKHEHRLSIRTGTFFSNSNLTLEEILQFVYMWVQGMPQSCIQHELGTSNTTDVDWASFCREVCEVVVMDGSEQIGGKDIVVEIDESKFAKRKYNVGHRVKGGWVFGGRERDNKKKVFMVPVEDRSAETLLSIIRKWIAPGSIIWSDCWKSYSRIPDLPEGYRHSTVNHSQNFVDPTTGTCTNRIESDWRHAKAEFPRFGTTPSHYEGYLSVFMWKRKHFGEDLFLAFIKDVAKVYPGFSKQ